MAAAATAAGGIAEPAGGSSGGQRKKRGRKPGSFRNSHMAQPQPALQSWLEKEQQFEPAAADQHARRLAAVFGGDQQAALASLPATFAWCTSQGLSGLQTAQLLDRIAKKRRDSVVSFAATAQRDWQLIEPYIAAHVRWRQQAGEQLPKHASLADVLQSRRDAARMLALAPGHVAAWLGAVSKQLTDAAYVGRLVLPQPLALTADMKTTLAVLRWFGEALGVPPAELAAFAARSPGLLSLKAATLRDNLAALQSVLPPEKARQLVQKQPSLLSHRSDTVQQALEWLQRQFGGDDARLQAVLERCPHLLKCSAGNLQRRANYVQRQLGWQPGDGQLAAFIKKYPDPFARIDFNSPDKRALLLLLSGVVGAERRKVLGKWSAYLGRGLETTVARYVLVQVRFCLCVLVQVRCCIWQPALPACSSALCAATPCAASSLKAMRSCHMPAGARALAAVRPQRRRAALVGHRGPQAAALLRHQQGGGAGLGAGLAAERAGPAAARNAQAGGPCIAKCVVALGCGLVQCSSMMCWHHCRKVHSFQYAR